MNKLISACTSVSRVFAWAGGFVLLCSAVLIALDVVFRALLKVTVFESFELSTYAFAISMTFGLAYALASRAHIRIEVVYNLLPVRARAWLDLFAYAVLAATSGVLLYWCSVTVLANAQSGARSNSALSVPLIFPQGAWLAGLAWFTIVAVCFSVAGIWTLARRGSQQTTALLGVATLQEEIDASTPESVRKIASA
ncbi:MAG: TRAP transporter small permease [Gammaproteobacteria bacterium]|nr:TRAP transporter small permease [Gammaproteobacteria bacterium]